MYINTSRYNFMQHIFSKCIFLKCLQYKCVHYYIQILHDMENMYKHGQSNPLYPLISSFQYITNYLQHLKFSIFSDQSRNIISNTNQYAHRGMDRPDLYTKKRPSWLASYVKALKTPENQNILAIRTNSDGTLNGGVVLDKPSQKTKRSEHQHNSFLTD